MVGVCGVVVGSAQRLVSDIKSGLVMGMGLIVLTQGFKQFT
jgi:hypothetical protein